MKSESICATYSNISFFTDRDVSTSKDCISTSLEEGTPAAVDGVIGVIMVGLGELGLHERKIRMDAQATLNLTFVLIFFTINVEKHMTSFAYLLRL